MTTFVATVPKSSPMTRSTGSRRPDGAAGLAVKGSLTGGLMVAWAACSADRSGEAWTVSRADLPVAGGIAVRAGECVLAGVAVDCTVPGLLSPPARLLAEGRPLLDDSERRSSVRKRRRNHCQTRQEPIGLLTPPGSNPRRSRLSA